MTYCDANGVPDRGQLRPSRSQIFIMAVKTAVVALKLTGMVASAAEGAGSRVPWRRRSGRGRRGADSSVAVEICENVQVF